MAVSMVQASEATSLEAAKEFAASRQRQPEMGSLAQLAAGGVAGAVSKTCTAPLARLTILFQVRGMRQDQLIKPSLFGEGARIFKQEGFIAFWKGNGVTIVHRLPYSSINFFSYEQYKKSLLKALELEQDSKHSPGSLLAARFIAGGGAGVTAAAITYPLDLTISKDYNGIAHALATISKHEGFLGLYKGLWPTLLSVGPTIAINFCVYETLLERWVEKNPESPKMLASLVAGGVSGIVASTAIFPIDLVKRRMQLEGDAKWRPAYKPGISSTLRHIVHTEGYRGLYRGIVPEYLKTFPGVGIAFMVYDVMKNLCSR